MTLEAPITSSRRSRIIPILQNGAASVRGGVQQAVAPHAQREIAPNRVGCRKPRPSDAHCRRCRRTGGSCGQARRKGSRVRRNWCRARRGHHTGIASPHASAREHSGLLGQRAATRHEPELRIQPTCRAVNKSFRECPAFSKPLSRRLSADPCFDREEFADPAQGVCCHRRSGGLSYVVKLAPRVAPARGESDALLVGQLPEAGVSCDMQDASEVRNMRDWNAQPCGLRRTDRLQPEVQVHPMAEVRGRRPQVAPFCFVRGRDRSRESTPRRSRICNCQ